jgi:hypothetical protein
VRRFRTPRSPNPATASAEPSSGKNALPPVVGNVVFAGSVALVVGVGIVMGVGVVVAGAGVVVGGDVVVVVGGAVVVVVVVDVGGAEPFHCTVLSVDVDADDRFAPRSEAAPAGILTTTTPAVDMPVTDTVYDAPLPLTVVTNEPPTVLPASETSPAVKPVTGSLNVTSKVIGEPEVGSACAAP